MVQTISLCMIVKGEEAVLKRCLKSIQDAVDEIVIVDTGSTDETKRIALQMGAKVFDFTWCDDFSAARNFAFSKAEMDYQMWLDADDVIPGDQKIKLIELKERMDGSVDVYMMPYCVSFDEEGQPTFNYFRERIVKRSTGFLWEGVVHEVITPRGRIEYSDVQVYHMKNKPSDASRNLTIYERLEAEGHAFSPRDLFYYASELYFNGRNAQAEETLLQFLDSGLGFIENKITACRYLYQIRRRAGETHRAIEALARSFEWGLPRAEVLCDLGGYFFARQRYEEAAHWYEQALACARVDTGGGFVEADCYDFIPYIQLCVCYNHMGLRAKAADYNQRALRIKPKNPAALSNKVFFMNSH